MSSITSTAKADALDGLGFAYVSLHDDFPGSIGANEVSGGGYARQAITVAAASGGQRLLTGTEAFTVPACDVLWVGFWKGDGSYYFAAPNGGFTPKNFMSISATDLIHAEAHGYSDTNQIVFYGGTPPAPLVEGTVYFVRDAAADSFKVAATSGGAAIDLTSAVSFGCVVSRITPQTYPTADTHTLTAATFAVPD